jgi:hypothetical protein
LEKGKNWTFRHEIIIIKIKISIDDSSNKRDIAEERIAELEQKLSQTDEVIEHISESQSAKDRIRMFFIFFNL